MVDSVSSAMPSHAELSQPVAIQKIDKEATIPLRHSVLWPNMPPEHVILPEDALGTHYGAFLHPESRPLAVISLYLEPRPTDDDNLDDDVNPSPSGTSLSLIMNERAVRFRKFACDPHYQGRGLGTQLLLHALSMARSEMGASIAWCDARKATEGWYRKRGFASFGNTFFKGPVEYVRMELDLQQLAEKMSPK